MQKYQDIFNSHFNLHTTINESLKYYYGCGGKGGNGMLIEIPPP